MLMNYHAKYLGPEREAFQSGYTVETLQLCSPALLYVLISIGVKRQTRSSNPCGICKALTPTFFFPHHPDHFHRSKALYHVRKRPWLCLVGLAVYEHFIFHSLVRDKKQ